MEAKPEPAGMQELSDPDLRLGVTAPDPGHPLASLFGGKGVYHADWS